MTESITRRTPGPITQVYRGVAAVAAENLILTHERQYMQPALPELQAVSAAPVETAERRTPHRRSTEKLSLREQLRCNKVGKKTVRLALAFGLVGGTILANTGPATADSSNTLEYTVTDAAAGGVYSRNSPHTEDTPRTVGKGIYPGDKVRLICGVTDGDPVGPNNKVWHKIVNETRPQYGEFWENDHNFDTPYRGGELMEGEEKCGETSLTTNKPSLATKGCYLNMKAPSSILTFSYEGDHHYYGNALQAAKEWSNLGTGVIITPGSGETYIRFKDIYSTDRKHNWFAKALVPENLDWQPQPHLNNPPQHPHIPTSITIEVNQYWIANKRLDREHIDYVLAHEIGHALGLAHNDDCNIGDDSVMLSGQTGPAVPDRTVITPQDYDKMEIEKLYGYQVAQG